MVFSRIPEDSRDPTDSGVQAILVDNQAMAPGKMLYAHPAMPENPKEAMGQAKPPLGLIPPSAEIEEARAFNYGAFHAPRKDGGFGYGPFNWRENPVKLMTYIHAMKRHIDDYLDGQHDAADSGVHHMGHLRACAAIIIDAESCGMLIDDRPKPGKAAELIEKYTVKS